MNWYLSVLKQYTNFSGRARRKEFWMFTLVNTLIIVVLNIISGAMATSNPDASLGLALPSVIYSFATLLPSIAVVIRRLHDTSRSGWWILLNFVPFGAIVLCVFLCLDSTPGENQFGANPKSV